MKPTLVLLLLACACSAPKTRGWIGGAYRRVDGLGVLLLDAPADTPIAAAGLRPGDVLTALDDGPVVRPDRFRRAIGEREPGAEAALTYWRAGTSAEARIRVGEETYRRVRTLTVALAASPQLDLWPFDDGIDVLGLVRLRRRDLFVLPVGLSWRNETLSTQAAGDP